MHHVLCRVLVKHQVTQVTQPRFGALGLLDFPKTKITFNGRDFRPSARFRNIQLGSWWQLGELGEVPRCLLWRDLRRHCPMYILVSSSINVPVFHIAWLDTSWTDLVCSSWGQCIVRASDRVLSFYVKNVLCLYTCRVTWLLRKVLNCVSREVRSQGYSTRNLQINFKGTLHL